MKQHQYAEFIKAFADGKWVEHRNVRDAGDGDKWSRVTALGRFDYTEGSYVSTYRIIEPEVVPYREAYLRGEAVEYRSGVDGMWKPCDRGCAWRPGFEYRIVPKYDPITEAQSKGPTLEYRLKNYPQSAWGRARDSHVINYAQYEYRVAPHSDPLAAIKEAYARGEKIERRFRVDRDRKWMPHDKLFQWDTDTFEYRIAPPDPFAEVKAAYARGEQIQFQYRKQGAWVDCDLLPQWLPENNYRVKPKQISYDLNITLSKGYGEGGVWTEKVFLSTPLGAKYPANVRFTFDPDTRDLWEVELLR